MTDPTPSPVPDLQTPAVLERWKRGHNGHREVFDAIAADLIGLKASLGGSALQEEIIQYLRSKLTIAEAGKTDPDVAALRKEHDEAQVMLNFEYVHETGDHGLPYPLTQRLRWYIERAHRDRQETRNTREQLALVQQQHLQDLHGPNGLWVRIHQQAKDLDDARARLAAVDPLKTFGMGIRVSYVGPDHENRGLTFGHLGSVCGETYSVATRSVYFDGKGRTPYRCAVEHLRPVQIEQPCPTCEGRKVSWSTAYGGAVTCPKCGPTDAPPLLAKERLSRIVREALNTPINDSGNGYTERLAPADAPLIDEPCGAGRHLLGLAGSGLGRIECSATFATTICKVVHLLARRVADAEDRVATVRDRTLNEAWKAVAAGEVYPSAESELLSDKELGIKEGLAQAADIIRYLKIGG